MGTHIHTHTHTHTHHSLIYSIATIFSNSTIFSHSSGIFFQTPPPIPNTPSHSKHPLSFQTPPPISNTFTKLFHQTQLIQLNATHPIHLTQSNSLASTFNPNHSNPL